MKFYILLLLSSLACNALAQEDLVVDPETTTTSTSTTTATTTATSTTTQTTTQTTTPTTTTTTTTIKPPTTTVKPTPAPYYNVTENNVTCILLDGVFNFGVTYSLSHNKTNTSTIDLPEPTYDSKVSGSCGETQNIKISWGEENKNVLKMVFNDTDDDKRWNVVSLQVEIYLDQKNFANGTDQGKTLISDVYLAFSPSEFAVNGSFKCYSKMEVANVSTTMDGSHYANDVTMTIDGIKLEAYNSLPLVQDKFATAVHCDLDKIADVVPIAVGLALGALIVIVLIAYIIGRRRRSAPYQSV